MTRTRASRVGWTIATVVLIGAAAVSYRAFNRTPRQAAATSPAAASSTPAGESEAHPPAEDQQGFLYGRVTTTVAGATYEGRLRFGGNQEAFWDDYFNGAKKENPWLAQVPPELLPKEDTSIQIFGLEIVDRETPVDLTRPFMARFGEMARIEAIGDEVRVTLKSGTVVDLDRFDASDFDDGVSVWNGERGVVNFDSLRIRSIELLPTPGLRGTPYRLHGTVRTRHGDFTGFIGWNRENYVGSDELDGSTAEGELSLRLDAIRSIARHSGDSSLVTLLDGREIAISGSAEAGDGNRGVYVADRRYGRVLIAWDAFERVDFSVLSPGGSGPAYGDFPPGSPLAGTVTTRDGRRFAGRLVYDLDESETTETLDAALEGVDYTIPFGLIAAIARSGRGEGGALRDEVLLHSGEALPLRRTGDLGDANAGMLIFIDGAPRPEYVPWTDVARVDFDRPAAMYPPLGDS